MRAAHTIKGSANNCGLDPIATIAHHLEDVFQSLYPQELEIDEELGSLLLDGYECLAIPLNAVISGATYDAAILESRGKELFDRLQVKLGDYFGREAPLPNAAELGFDVVGTVFLDSVPQDLEDLENAIATANPQVICDSLLAQASFFSELGAAYSLPGLVEIAETIEWAITQQPDRAIEIAQGALNNLRSAQVAILAGDRVRGGEISPELSQWIAPPMATTTVLTPEPVSPKQSPAAPDRDLLEQRVNTDLDVVTLPSSFPSPTMKTAGSPLDRMLASIWTGDRESHHPLPPPPQSPTPKPISDPSTGASIRVAVEQLDRLSYNLGELSIDANQQKLQGMQINELARSTFDRYLLCQQQLSKIRDLADRHLLGAERQRWQEQLHIHVRHPYSLFQSGKASRAKSAVNYPEANYPRNLSRDPHRGDSRSQNDRDLAPHPSTLSNFDSLELDLYTNLDLILHDFTEQMILLGEQIEILESNTQQFQFNLNQRRQLIGTAQSELLQARMIPISTVFDRFSRTFQQSISRQQKPALLQVSGENVSIDKVIVEKLYEPLMHLIRNAYDHGLESTETRQQLGKSSIGNIVLRAYNQGNRTTIDVTDDGAGVDWHRIRAKAIELDIFTPTQAAQATESELAEILFTPRFSTTEQVNDFSGRGIGLNVVSERIRSLQGSIGVKSVVGQGTTFSLQIPLSLTTARLMVCESQGTLYALLTDRVERAILPTPDRLQQPTAMTENGIEGYWRSDIGTQEQLIPIYSIEDLLPYHCPIAARNIQPSPSPTNNSPSLMLLSTEEQQVCVKVERIVSEQELVIKSLGNTFDLPKYVQGYSVLGDSGLTLVIDPIDLVTQSLKTPSLFTEGGNKLSSFTPPPLVVEIDPTLSTNDSDSGFLNKSSFSFTPKIAKSRIMIVEDSLVQRQSLVQTLHQAGYQILQANNGKQALLQLNRYPDVKLIICDIEMPHMNGFEFLSHCCQNPTFAHIPVIMLTTRNSPKHRQLAMTLGAKGYLTKPYEDTELLQTISNFLN
jgi:two-component system, chemotaxis family, sensor histidine kinase and response regulator PixL